MKYKYDETKGTDYNYEVGYLDALRQMFRLTTSSKIPPCIEAQLDVMKGLK